jgi:hypothetical protein
MIFSIKKNNAKPTKRLDRMLDEIIRVISASKFENIFPIILEIINRLCSHKTWRVNPLSDEPSIAKIINDIRASISENISA